MVTLVIIKNAFHPNMGRVTKTLKNAPPCVEKLLDEYSIGDTTYCATINGVSAANDTPIKDNDFIVIYPEVAKGGGGKSVVGIVAAIALTVVSFGVGGAISAATGAAAAGWGAAMTTWTTWGFVAAFAVTFIGSTLVQRFMGSNIDTGSYKGDSTSDPTYSWSGVTTMEGQNNAISITYGKVKSGGQTIGKYVSTTDNKEYLNWLVSAGEGPLTSITDIRLNDNPISYYTGATADIRLGANDQDLINNFNDTYYTDSLGYILTTTARTVQVQGTATQGIIVKAEFSSGLYYANDDGSLGTAWVKLHADYRLQGTTEWHSIISDAAKISSNYHNATLNTSSCENGNYSVKAYRYTDENGIASAKATVTAPSGTKTSATSTSSTISCGPFTWAVSDLSEISWFGIGSSTGNITVTGNNSQIEGSQSSALRREWRVDGLASGAYEVQMYVVARSHDENSSRASVKCYWTGLTSVIYDDFVYPNIALVGIKALATNQISGQPNLTFIKERATVQVWNPTTAAYEEQDATNPAWAAYDMVHQCTKIKNISTGSYEYEVRGAPADLMIYSQFAEWAAFCSAKNLHINQEFTSVSNMMDLVNSEIAPIGRGFVLWFGTKCGCIWSCTKQATQMFGMGNIIAGTFKEEFLDPKDRANCLEITFTNATADYERTPITVYGDDYDTAEFEKRTQVTMNGITSYEQAYREGKYQLYCNQYLLRMVSFEADVDAISCTIGDVIIVAHDVPEWSYSGRISAVGTKQLTLPVEVTDTSKSYEIMYRTVNDNKYTVACQIVSTGSGYTTVSVTDDFSADDPPQVNDIFDLAIVTIGRKKFTVQSLSRTQENKYAISGIEYNENILNENYTVPPLNYSMADNLTPQNVQQLSVKQVAWKDGYGVVRCRMYASWTLPQGAPACRYTVLLSTDGTNYSVAKSNLAANSTEIDTLVGQQYWVKVISTLSGRTSSGTVTGPVSAGLDTKPPDVTALHHELMADGMRRFWWDYTYPSPNDVAGFRLRYTPNGSMGWSDALPLHEGIVTSQPFETGMLRQGMATVLIKAVDNAGNESSGTASLQINLGDVLQENVLYSKDLAANSWGDVTHDGYVDPNTGELKGEGTTAMWSSPDSPMWSAPDSPMWVSQFKSFTATYSFTAPASGQFWMDLTVTGPLKISYSVNGGNAFPYSQKVMVKAGDVILVTMTAYAGLQQVEISKATLYIDVPDVVEHFNNVAITTDGTTLQVKCPHYYTTAVRIDAVENNAWVQPQIVTRNPCVIKLLNSSGTAVAGTIDCTWQGFVKEVNA